MKVKSPLIALCIVLLSGCATMNEQECRTADWYRIGARDGQQGAQLAVLEDHRESCKRYGIQPGEYQYHLGREEGLKQYCRPGNAFRLGLNGTGYTGVCPMDVDYDFRRYNTAALDVHKSLKKVEEIDHQLSQKEHELGGKDTSEKDRKRLRGEVRDLERTRDRVRSELHFQQLELDRLMDDERRRVDTR